MKTTMLVFLAPVMMFFHSACTYKPEIKEKGSELQLRAPATPKPSSDGIMEAQQEAAHKVVMSCIGEFQFAAMAWMKPRKLELAGEICDRITEDLPASGYRIMEQGKVEIEPFGKDEKLAKVPFVLVDGGQGTISLYMKESSGTWWVVRLDSVGCESTLGSGRINSGCCPFCFKCIN